MEKVRVRTSAFFQSSAAIDTCQSHSYRTWKKVGHMRYDSVITDIIKRTYADLKVVSGRCSWVCWEKFFYKCRNCLWRGETRYFSTSQSSGEVIVS